MDLFEKARELGQALHLSGEYQRLAALEEALTTDKVAKDILDEIALIENDIREMMGNAPLDQDAMDAKVARHKELKCNAFAMPIIKDQREAQADFACLMQKVNEIVSFFVTGRMDGKDGGCQGDCSGCSSCPGCGQDRE